MPVPPIPGAPDGRVARSCQHEHEFKLVRRFAGIETWQCLVCRKISEVITHPVGEKTCLHCGKALAGRQSSWCCAEHGIEYADHKNRSWWAWQVKKRDCFACRKCGWKPTQSGETMYRYSKHEPDPEGRFQLEAHHVHPIEYGGDEFDLENGLTMCNRCHDEEHRYLASQGMPVGKKRRKKKTM